MRQLPSYVSGWFYQNVNPDITTILMEKVFGLGAGEDAHLARLSRASERAYDLILYDYNGTLVETLSGDAFPRNTGDWRVLPRRQTVCARWQALGVRMAIVTNQGGVAFGYQRSGDIAYQIEHVGRDLGMIGAMLCYGHPQATWHTLYITPPDDDWRKPGPAMLQWLMDMTQVTPERTLMVGDRPEDAEAAKRAGVAFQWASEHFGDGESEVSERDGNLR